MSSSEPPNDPLDEVVPYYERTADEQRRLTSPRGQLELQRTRTILKRYLPAPPAVILDVGGGAGVYSFWLAEQGYQVHLVDAVPLHIDQARKASRAHTDSPLASVSIGDARSLNMPDQSVDAVLMLGPLYHLPDRTDRLTALKEAHRVLRVGGHLFVAAISRFASLLAGFFHGGIDDEEFVQMMKRDLADGCHYNPPRKPYFTTAYFHLPEELANEVKSAGFEHHETLAIEGPFWLLQNLHDHWSTAEGRQRVLDAVTLVEDAPAILGASNHIMTIGRKG